MRRKKDAGDVKYLKLRKELRDFIDSNPSGMRLPSYSEMIRKYEVSQATIDRAMQEFDEAKLIRREHGRGIFISPVAKTKRIGMVFGQDIFSVGVSPVYGIILDEAQRRIEGRGYEASFFIDSPQVPLDGDGLKVHRDLKEAVDERKLDGILLFMTRGIGEVEWLFNSRIPLVVFSNRVGPAHGICFDIGALAGMGTELLLSQGCRRVALLSLCGHQRNQGVFEDIEAYKAALAAKGLPFDPKLFWDLAPLPGTKSNEEIGYGAMKDLLSSSIEGGGAPLDGMVSLDDMATRGAIVFLREAGLKLKIATHANKGSPALLGEEKRLSIIELDPREIASKAFSMLSDIMDGADVSRYVTVKPYIRKTGI